MYDLPKFLEIKTEIPFTGNAFDVAQEIGYFSIISENGRMKVQNDDSMKKYYFRRRYRRQDRCDLNEGYDENFKMNPFTDEKIDNLLNWIMNKRNFQPVLSEDCADFVTSRSTIKKLLCTPFCTEKWTVKWRMYACKFRKTIYLISMDTEEKIAEESNPTQKSRKRTYQGKKFEQYMTTSDPESEPDLTLNCCDMGFFCIIATNRIGDHKLLFRAEMDAMKSDPEHPGDTSQYVEIKTCKPKELKNKYSYKPLLAWAQCTVVGVKDIVWGYRNESGILKGIGEHNVAKLPEIQETKYRNWSPEGCFNFCNYFLQFLKDNMQDDYKSVFRFDYTGGSQIRIRPEEDEKILPDDFVQKFLAEELASQSESEREKEREGEGSNSKRKQMKKE